jgi:hypothetical protein
VEGLRVDQLLTSQHFGLLTSRSLKTEELFTEYYDPLAKRELDAEERARLEHLETELHLQECMGTTRLERIMLQAIDGYLATETERAIEHYKDDPHREDAFKFSVYSDPAVKDALGKLSTASAPAARAGSGPPNPLTWSTLDPRAWSKCTARRSDWATAAKERLRGPACPSNPSNALTGSSSDLRAASRLTKRVFSVLAVLPISAYNRNGTSPFRPFLRSGSLGRHGLNGPAREPDRKLQTPEHWRGSLVPVAIVGVKVWMGSGAD